MADNKKMLQIGQKSDEHIKELMDQFSPPEAIMCAQMTITRLWYAAGADKASTETSIESMRRLFEQLCQKAPS